jgi:hypothetical protein
MVLLNDSILASRTIVLIERVHLDLTGPKRPRSGHCTLQRFPRIRALSIAQVLQVPLSLSLPRFDVATALNVYFAFDGEAKVCIVDRQRCSLRLRGLPGVDGLVHSFFDTTS